MLVHEWLIQEILHQVLSANFPRLSLVVIFREYLLNSFVGSNLRHFEALNVYRLRLCYDILLSG